MTNLRW